MSTATLRRIVKRLTIRRRALAVYMARVKPHYPDQGHVARMAVLDTMYGFESTTPGGAWPMSRWSRNATRLERLCKGKPAFKPVKTK